MKEKNRTETVEWLLDNKVHLLEELSKPATFYNELSSLKDRITDTNIHERCDKTIEKLEEQLKE